LPNHYTFSSCGPETVAAAGQILTFFY